MVILSRLKEKKGSEESGKKCNFLYLVTMWVIKYPFGSAGFASRIKDPVMLSGNWRVTTDSSTLCHKTAPILRESVSWHTLEESVPSNLPTLKFRSVSMHSFVKSGQFGNMHSERQKVVSRTLARSFMK